MKAEKLLMSISLLAVLLLFSGCGKELENMIIPETGSGVESPDGSDQAEGEILHLQVSDAGFSDANTGSRAIDEGLTTTFEDGDQIGLFVVNIQDKILYANVPYTKDGDVWTAKENIRTKGYPVRVFAYYPYVPDDEIIEKIDSTADNYSDFFKTYIDELDISNQSSLADYRKADVMACMVKVESKEEARQPLTLTMNHLMGLVIVKHPETVTLEYVQCYLKDDPSYEWTSEDVLFPANLSNESFSVDGIQHLKGGLGTGYYYLCRPGEKISFSGDFTTYGKEKGYKMESTVNAGSSKTYNVSVASFRVEGKVEYAPQIGDFYMNDGDILPIISEKHKNNCIGIVFWSPTETDPLDSHNAAWLADHPNCTHGLVVGLQQIQTSWGVLGTWMPTSESSDGIFRGYSNTNQLASSHPDSPIINFYNSIKQTVSLPRNKTSGWYVPSVSELSKLCGYPQTQIYSMVNISLKKLIDLQLSIKELLYGSSKYWTAGGFSYSYAFYVDLRSDGSARTGERSYNHSLRLIFAF